MALFAHLLTTSLSGATIEDTLSLLQSHDRIVYDFQQSITLIAVEKVDNERIVLQVATGTKDLLDRTNLSSWLTWYDQGCPDASSRESISITLQPRITIRAEDPQKVSWLLTLLNLPLSAVPDSARKKAGPPPSPDEPDFRKPWQPPIIVNGARIATPSTAFSTTWPPDDTQLANRILILYFPTSDTAVPVFPYWIESPSSSYHVKVIDSSR